MTMVRTAKKNDYLASTCLKSNAQVSRLAYVFG